MNPKSEKGKQPVAGRDEKPKSASKPTTSVSAPERSYKSNRPGSAVLSTKNHALEKKVETGRAKEPTEQKPIETTKEPTKSVYDRNI